MLSFKHTRGPRLLVGHPKSLRARTHLAEWRRSPDLCRMQRGRAGGGGASSYSKCRDHYNSARVGGLVPATLPIRSVARRALIACFLKCRRP